MKGARWPLIDGTGWATKAQLRNMMRNCSASIATDTRKNPGDDLPAGVDLAVFEFAVNSGPQRAASTKWTIVGVAPDGEIGPLTIAAAKNLPPTTISDLCSQRLVFLERLSTWPVFRKGWAARVIAVPPEANAVAARPSPFAPKPAPARPTIPIVDEYHEAPKPKGRVPVAPIVTAVMVLALTGAFFFWRF